MKRTTKEPVQLGGWYENTDGTVTHYGWLNGRLCAGRTLRDWAAVDVWDRCNATYPGPDQIETLRVLLAPGEVL